MTALLDAVGKTIRRIDLIGHTRNKAMGNKVLFVIITDGKENYSEEYTYADVKKLIKDRQENAGWEFIFLGANIDAAAEAENLVSAATARSNIKIRAAVSAPTSRQWRKCRTLLPSRESVR